MKVANKASGVKAERGISNKLAPLPLKTEPDDISIPPLTNKEPVNCEPLSNASTLKPYSGLTDAVILPLDINVANNASGVSAERGISNRLAPLPLKDEPLIIEIPPLTNKEPVNREPICADSTTNPLLELTDAVTLPLAILYASVANADIGMLNKPSPEPVNADADTLFVKNAGTFTLNPSTGEIDAVAEPLNIFVLSIDRFDKVIFLN